jgi:hypothetical protein
MATDVTIGEMVPANRALALDDKLEIETSGTTGRYITGQEVIDRVNSDAVLDGISQVNGLEDALAAKTTLAEVDADAQLGSTAQVDGLDDALNAKQSTSEKDASNGYAGLTLFKINFKNVGNTFTSFFTNSNTAARTYTFQDRDGTIADNTDLAAKANTSITISAGGLLTGGGDLSANRTLTLSANAVLQPSNNLSDVASVLTGQFNLNVDCGFDNTHTSEAASFTLTNPLSTRTHFGFTNPGQFVTLPAMNTANSMGRAGLGRVFVLRNVGSLDGGIKDNLGNTLVPALPQGWDAWFFLGSNSTAGGLFAIWTQPSQNYSWKQSNVENLVTDLAAKASNADLQARILAPVADLAALKAINTTGFASGIAVRCVGLGSFIFVSGASDTGDDYMIVQPTTGGGRWYRVAPLITNSRSLKVNLSVVDVTLTNPASRIISITSARSGAALQLPAANGNYFLQDADYFLIDNTTQYDVIIKNGSGTPLGTVVAGQQYFFHVYDITSAGGQYIQIPGVVTGSATLTLGNIIDPVDFTGNFTRFGDKVLLTVPNVPDQFCTSTGLLEVSGVPAKFSPVSVFDNITCYVQTTASAYGQGIAQFVDGSPGTFRVFGNTNYDAFAIGQSIGIQACTLTYSVN